MVKLRCSPAAKKYPIPDPKTIIHPHPPSGALINVLDVIVEAALYSVSRELRWQVNWEASLFAMIGKHG